MGVSMEQISSAVREHLSLPPGTPVNIMFGVVEGRDRELAVSFQAVAAGKNAPGRVVFQILEANSRMWGGSAILLDGRVDLT